MSRSGKDKNYVSFWFWLLVPLIVMLPCIGVVMAIIWAFTGDNQSRKNYFRALLVWMLVLPSLSLMVISLPVWPEIFKHLQAWLHQLK